MTAILLCNVNEDGTLILTELLGSTHSASADDYSCSQIIRLSLARNSILSDETSDLTTGNSISNSCVQITSFDM